MKVKTIIALFLNLLVTGSTIKAQDTVALSLPNIFKEVDESYPLLRVYQNRISSIRALAEGARSWMPPTVSVAIDKFPYQLSMIREKSAMNQAGIMFSAQQMIPNAAKLNAKRDFILSQQDISSNEAEWEKNVLHYAARLYYYRRFTAERKIKLVHDYEGLLKMLVKTARDKYVYNQSDLPSIFKAEASLSELKNMETMLLSQVAESTIGINTLLSRDVNTPFVIDSLLQPTDYQADFVNTDDTTFFNRSDILATESRIRSMKSSLRLAATGSKPDFGIQFSHGQMFGMPNQFSLMGMVTIPIVPWSSRMYKSEVRSMNFDIEAMQNERSTMRLMTRQMIREKITMLNFENQQLRNFDISILPAYRKNLESNLLAYRQNTGNFFVLLDAWNMLLMKEMERIDKLAQVFAIQSEYEYQREKK
ncbi:Outer membrane protein TolC [Daejeonella rubra]|uniref:Outer membrane protein TolC n=1 Tax=Daejeonella rubra TaxID=990371 RepID=A0A1G9NNK4_9SPHI|nr:TolC family protein [Daejeonella rubra]SDL87970.1 Outer membrane protein TolC [Daejeonella rubra]